MAITSSSGDGVRLTTAAKNGTLGSQSGAASDEIIFDSAITTNNGNLAASPTFVNRMVVKNWGAADEETRLIIAIVSGNQVQVHEDWVDAPVSGDTYHVSYVREDVATVTGGTISSKTSVLEMTRPLSIGNSGGGGANAFFSMHAYQGIELDNPPSSTRDTLIIEDNGRMQCGYILNNQPVSGAIITAFRNTAGENLVQLNGGCILKIYSSIFRSWLADLLWLQTYDSTSIVEINGLLHVQALYNTTWRIGNFADITLQGSNVTQDLVLIEDSAVFEQIRLNQSNGWTSNDDGVTESLLLLNVNFIKNLKHVTVHDDKRWFFVDSVGWISNSTFIAFQVDDLNEVVDMFSTFVSCNDQSQNPLENVPVYIQENQNIDAIFEQAETDANGEAEFYVGRNVYSYPSAVFTATALGNWTFKAVKYGKLAIVFPFPNDNEQLYPLTLVTDVAITEASQPTATANGVGIVPTRHATGETDPRPVNLIRFTSGTDGGDGAPSVGDTISGGTSSATGEVVEIIGNAFGNGYLVLENRNANTFSDGETLTDTTQTNQWTATSDTTPSPGVDLDFTWMIDADGNSMSVVYDYLSSKMANRRYPITFEDDGGAFTDFSTAVDEVYPGDNFRVLPTTPAVNDALYLGERNGFVESYLFNLNSAAANVTITWEYWNGSTWASLTGVTDGTSSFSTSGQLDFTLPSNWAKTTVNSVNAYWIRGRVSAVGGSPAGGYGKNVWTDFIYWNLQVWGLGEQAQALYSGPSGYFTPRVVSTTEGVIVVNRGAGTIDYFTADDGTEWTPPSTVTHTVTGLQTGSRVVWIRQSDGAELENKVESGGTASYTYTWTSDTDVWVQILSQSYLNKIVSVTLTATSQSLPASQAIDRFYSNP